MFNLAFPPLPFSNCNNPWSLAIWPTTIQINKIQSLFIYKSNAGLQGFHSFLKFLFATILFENAFFEKMLIFKQ